MAATRRDRPILVMKVLIGIVLSMILVIGGSIGWAFFKFSRLDKIAVGTELGVRPNLTAGTIAYPEADPALDPTADPAAASTGDVAVGTTPEISLDPSASTTVPGTAVTDPGAATTVPGASAPSTTAPAAGAGAVPPGAAPGAAPSIAADVAAALDQAGAQDEAEVQAGIDGGPTTTLPIPTETIPPGLIVGDLASEQSFGGSSTKNYLMIGVDSRSNLEGQEVGFGVGKVSGSRTDTIIVLRIDQAAKRAWLLSIPRDLWVPIAGLNRWDRINAAFSSKGAGNLVKTIRDRLGIGIDSVVRVDFAGFQRIVGTLGGVDMCLKYPARDHKSGLNRPTAGCQHFDARGATAYVRSRYYEQEVNGVWQRDPRGDLGRIVRQQEFIRTVISKARDAATNPLTLNALSSDMQQAVAIDKGFSLGDTARLASDLRSFDPATLEAFTVPTSATRINGKAVLIMNKSKAKAVLGKFAG